MALDVLIVDDSSVTRKVIARALKFSGLEIATIHEASDGQDAYELVEHTPVDLALVDINMPRMNGEELVSRWRAVPATASLPVVVVSTEGSETRIARLRSMGVAFLHKPFGPAELCETVTGLLEAKSA